MEYLCSPTLSLIPATMGCIVLLGMVEHTCKSNACEVEAAVSVCWFRVNIGYGVRLCLKTTEDHIVYTF